MKELEKVYDDIEAYFAQGLKSPIFYFEDFHLIHYDDFIPYDEVHEEFIDLEKPHRRGFFEIGIIFKDSSVSKIDHYNFQYEQNKIVTISPYQRFSVVHPQTPEEIDLLKNDDGYILAFKNTFFPSELSVYDAFPFFKLHTSTIYSFTNEQVKELRKILEEMHKELHSDGKFKREILSAQFMQFMYILKRYTSEKEEYVLMNRYQTITSQFEQLLTNYQNGFFSIKEYAIQLNISAVYLSECVKKATGLTAKQVITNYKKLHAQSLLLQKEKTVIEIAELLDFSETSNFVKFFKKHFHVSPLQYRKQHMDIL